MISPKLRHLSSVTPSVLPFLKHCRFTVLELSAKNHYDLLNVGKFLAPSASQLEKLSIHYSAIEGIDVGAFSLITLTTNNS
jgi:hypothetical protein